MKKQAIFWGVITSLFFNFISLSIHAEENREDSLEQIQLIQPKTRKSVINAKSTGTYRNFSYTLNDDNTVVLNSYLGTALTVSIPSDVNGYPVTEIGQDCFYSSSVRSVIIPNGILKIGPCAFESCEDLTTISIPSTVTEIGTNAFYSCKNLVSCTMSSGVQSIGRTAFYNCPNLQSIIIPSTVSDIKENAFNGCVKLLSAGPIGSQANVQIGFTDTIYSWCRYVFNNIESVTLPNSVKKIEDYAFSDCSNLKSITLPESVTELGDGVFSGCENLMAVSIPNTVSSIGNSLFSMCTKLETVSLPDSMTEIGEYMFSGCRSLASYTIPRTVTKIGNSAFLQCESLTEMIIPDSVQSIGISAFRGCSGISEFVIPDSVSSLESLVFEDCTNLVSVRLSSAISAIPQNLFYGCTKLQSVEVPEGVQKLSANAFANCASLKMISLPSTITYIDQNIFNNSPKVQTIVYNGLKKDWEAITKFYSGISSSIHIKFNDGYNTFDFTASSADESGEGYEWNKSRKELTLSGFNVTFSANPGILVPYGTSIIFKGENTIVSVYTSSEPGDILRVQDGIDVLLLSPGSDGSVLNIVDEGNNNGISVDYGMTGPWDNTIPGTVNITSNATGINFRNDSGSGSFHSGKLLKINIDAKRGIDYKKGLDVTNTSQGAELNITASDIGIVCNILDMGDASYDIHVTRQSESDAGIGIKAKDIVEQVGNGNRGGSLYIEADTAAFEYNGDYETRINLYSSSYAIVEPYHFDQGDSIYFMNLDTGEPARVLSIQPVILRVFGGDIVSVGEQTQISADDPSLGYEFDKWVKANGNGTESYGNISAMFTNAGSSVNDSEAALIPNGKTYILSTYRAINYPIIYDLNYAGSDSEPVHANPKNTYTIKDSFELVNPEMEGYVFTGWSGTGLEGEDNLNVAIPAGTTGELSFTAHWEKEKAVTHAYAVVTDDGDLVFFRSEDVYQNDTIGSFTDVSDNVYTGRVFSSVENIGKNIEEPAPWWMYMSSIKQVYVAEGQTISPRGMANWFQSLHLMSFNATGFDTSNVQNMYHLFYNCNSLSSLDVSSFDTSNVTNMHAAFSHCASLKTLELGEMNTSNVTDMGSMFEVNPQLTSLDLSSFDTSNVKSMRAMFYGDSSLLSLDLHVFNTAEVTDMFTMFAGCNSLNELNIEGFITGNVTNMGSMFSGCSSLVTLNLSHFDTSAVTDMSSMFRSCESLEELNISSFAIASASYANNIFTDDNSLKTIQIGSGFKMNSSSGLPEGNWENGSLVKTADQLMEGYNSNASEWQGIWTRTILVKSITLDKRDIYLAPGDTITLIAEILPENAHNKILEWSSTDSSIAVVDNSGTVTAVGKGNVRIVARATDGTNISSYCTVTVSIPVTGISLDHDSIILRKGEAQKLNPTVIPDNADNQNVVWSSSDESVAIVDTKGDVTGIISGTAVITVMTEEGEYSADCNVTVENPVETIALNKTEVTGDIGDIIHLAVTAEPDDADPYEIIWTSANDAVASVDQNGIVTIIGVGQTLITASVSGTEISVNCTISSSHNYDAPTYKWEEVEEGYRVTAETICRNNEEHKLTETVNAVKEVKRVATCEETGQVVYIAEFENELFEAQKKDATVLPIGHNYGEWIIVRKASCTEEGEEQRICANNPDHIETRFIEKIPHDLIKAEGQSPSCEESGNTEYWTCQICGGYFSDAEGKTQINENAWSIPALGHEWGEWHVLKEAACETDGTEQRICVRNASHTEERTIPLTGHNYGEWTIVTEAGCEENGIKQRVCANDATHIETEVIPATGHNYGNWTIITEPGCETPGIRQQVCANDETHVNQEEIPAVGHKWGNWTLIKEATCEENGEEIRICENDDTHAETRKTDSIGHKLIQTQAVKATCEKGGNTEYWTCERCGKYYTDEAGTLELEKDSWITEPLGHEWGEGKVTREATYYEEGEMTYTCRHDSSHIRTEVIPVIPVIEVNGIELNESELILKPGQAAVLTAIIEPEEATFREIKWSTDNPEIVNVDQYGALKAIKDGKAVITAETVNGIKAECNITVKTAVTGVCFSRTEETVIKGKTLQLEAIVLPEEATVKKVYWKSSNEKTVTVDERGLVRGVATGSAVITVITEDGAYTAECTIAVVKEKVEMYRMYNPYTQEHLYTGLEGERDNLVSHGWIYEGFGFYAPKESSTPMYRLYNPNNSDHHYTASEEEIEFCVRNGWIREGICWYADDDKEVAQYRLFNPYIEVGSHHYTYSEEERDFLASIGWIYEGIGFYTCK